MEIKVIIEAPELASAINNLAAALSKGSIIPKSETPLPVAPSVPVAPPPQYTIEQLIKAGAALMDAGKMQELRALIKSFNVEAVTNLKPEQFGAFATELRKLGAKI